MIKYCTKFSHFCKTTGTPYFYIFRDFGSGWTQVTDQSYPAEDCQHRIKSIIAGEKEWIVVPKDVTRNEYYCPHP